MYKNYNFIRWNLQPKREWYMIEKNEKVAQMRNLSEIRNEIDDVDRQLVALYEKRMQLTRQVADYKIATGKPVFDKTREIEKIKAVTELTKDPTLKNGVEELFEQIMSMSRKRQYQMMAEPGRVEAADFREVDVLPREDIRIVYQGEEGANSQIAMQAFFGADVKGNHVETWRDAMEAIKNGDADYAVLPIENSSAGIVSENYDLLVEYNAVIVGEQIIKIDHCLLGQKEAELSDIKRIYSHPQALMQCNRYLDRHREWETHSVKNTAVAAKKVKEDGLLTQAAIASRPNAKIYGLKVLKENFQNNENNSTRFVIVTAKKIFVKNAGKISICFEIPHESGSLYHMLSHFIYNNLNMNKIESRPIQKRNWEYRFFVDFEGNLNDGGVRNALHGLQEETTRLRILGNY